jgi:ubiquinone biosynthesis protein UbiJ
VISDQLASRFETLLNYYLRLDPETNNRMSALSGKIIAIDIFLGPLNEPAPHITLYFLPENQGCQVTTNNPGEPDVMIRGTPLSLMGQLQEGSRGGVMNDIDVAGDLALGKAFQDIVHGVHIDWEEQLAHWLGDLPAHQMGNGLRQLQAWTSHSLQKLAHNSSEYLHYEANHLPTPRALNEFIDAVDKIYTDTERLQARIQRLQRASTATSPTIEKPNHSQ